MMSAWRLRSPHASRRPAILTERRGERMTRLSGDEWRDGYVWNGFDYALQVWVVEGIAQPCGHPPRMCRHAPCGAAVALAGQRVDRIPGAQRQDRE